MEETLQGLQIGIDNMWLLIAGFMVMFMQPGFAMVEAGFTRSKNTANILMKNLMDFSRLLTPNVIILILGFIYFQSFCSQVMGSALTTIVKRQPKSQRFQP